MKSKKLFIIGLFSLLFYNIDAQQVIDTILPVGNATLWTNNQCGLLETQQDTLVVYGADSRIGANVQFKGFFDFTQNGEAYFKWKYDGQGWSAWGFGMPGAEYGHTPSTLSISSSNWYYSHIKINASDSTYVYNVSSGNYDDQGGTTMFQTTSRNIKEKAWELLKSSTVLFRFNDNYGGTNTKMSIAEIKLHQVVPVQTPTTTDVTYNFENGQIPANFILNGNTWNIQQGTGNNTTQVLYGDIPIHEEASVVLNLQSVSKIGFDIKYQSETHKYMRFWIDSIGVAIFDAHNNTCWKHFEYVMNDHNSHQFTWKVRGTQYDQLPGEIWIDNITITYDPNAQRQYTLIPDPNFEAALSAYDDIPNDGKVPTNNINTITNLDVSNKNISDLTGIQDFTALEYLSCHDNNLTTLNLTNCDNLAELYCGRNNLNSLDLNSNTALTHLACSVNNLDSLNINNNPNLLVLYCDNNNLTSLDISNNTALNELHCNGNDFVTLSFSNNTSLSSLYCDNNYDLISLDVSNDASLTLLHCDHCSLTSLNTSNNTALTYLYCRSNNLTSLDVSSNTALTELHCYINDLINLDLTNNPNLQRVSCDNNQLEHLDIRNGNNQNISFFDVRNNPNLTCIFVDDASWSTAHWTNIDATSHFVETQTECDNYLSVNQLKDNKILIYPNPFNENIYIKNYDKFDNYTIFDTQGKVIKKSKLSASAINLRKIKTGVYFIRLRGKRGSKFQKIIKL